MSPKLWFGSFTRLAVAAFALALLGTAAVVSVALAQPGRSSTGVVIQAQEYSFNAPATIPSGLVSFSFQNLGREDHFAQFFRLNPGVTPDDLKAALARGGAPETLPLITTSGGGSIISPGASQDFTVEMAPGSYVLLCFLRDDEHEGDHPDDDSPIPHSLKGMFHPFTVPPTSGGTATTAARPAADVTVMATEFAFEVPAITAGQHTVQFDNVGAQAHEMTLLKVVDDVSPEQAQKAVEGGAVTVPFHVQSAGGLAAIPPSSSGWATVDFTPGLWMMVCYVPNTASDAPDENGELDDADSGEPHATLGMVRAFRVQ